MKERISPGSIIHPSREKKAKKYEQRRSRQKNMERQLCLQNPEAQRGLFLPSIHSSILPTHRLRSNASLWREGVHQSLVKIKGGANTREK